MSVDVDNASLAPRADYQKVLAEIVSEGLCPFCEGNLERHHREPILWTSDHWLVTNNAWPYKGSRLHFLFIARNHVEDIQSLSEEAWQSFFKDYERLIQEFSLEGATLLWRSGGTHLTGASVRHLHAQVIVGHPRHEGAAPITALAGFATTEVPPAVSDEGH